MKKLILISILVLFFACKKDKKRESANDKFCFECQVDATVTVKGGNPIKASGKDIFCEWTQDQATTYEIQNTYNKVETNSTTNSYCKCVKQ
jgi:hypothetical protein